jgi:hypothetical protein
VCVCVCVRVCVCVCVPTLGVSLFPRGPMGPSGPKLGVSLFARGPLGPWARSPDPAINSPNVMLFVWILALRL